MQVLEVIISRSRRAKGLPTSLFTATVKILCRDVSAAAKLLQFSWIQRVGGVYFNAPKLG